MTAREDQLLAAEYVLGVLPHEERRAFEQRLASEAQLSRFVKEWEAQFAPFQEEIAPAEPPAATLRQIEERLFQTPASPTGWWNSLAFWRSLATASLAAAAVFAVFLSTQPKDAGGELVAQLSGETDVRLVALYDRRTATLKLNRIAGNRVQGRELELWLIEGSNAPVSLGVLNADARDTITVPEALRKRLVNATLAVSDEPPGGSPTGQPTGAVLATGPLTEI
jgi:anti-sigma-K factor RskA